MRNIKNFLSSRACRAWRSRECTWGIVALRFTTLAMTLSLFIVQAFAQDSSLQQKFDTANQAYFSRNFPEAIQDYKQLEKQGIVSADLFYNLANSYYRQGEIGEAIYNYLKAIRLTPRDRDLVANYNYILTKRAEGHEVRLRDRLLDTVFFLKNFLTLNEILIVSLVSYWLLFAFAVLYYLKRKKGWMWVLVVFGVFNIYILPTTFQKYYEEKIQKVAVVITPTVSVFSEPTTESIKLFELHEGSMAQVKDQKEGFVKIRFKDGKIGWAKQDQLQIL